MASDPELRAFTVEGPVQAEIMVLALAEGELVLTGPCGAAPWYVEVGQDADPMAVVAAISRVNVGEPAVVHSTSWRHARGGVILTFVVVYDDEAVADLARVPVERHELARGEATTAPRQIPAGPVIEHGLRHLAWLARDDAAVADALPPGWLSALDSFVPEPFRHL
ncbi:MAG TPA: hypothetical protein VLM11_00430 [Streptosporangiaceae bacterium]|nr:hypothetical protein [Streptosporangiaceae bacterium]